MADIIDVLGKLRGLAQANRYTVMFGNIDELAKDETIFIKSISISEHKREEGEYWNKGIKYIIPREVSFTNELSITFTQEETVNIRGILIGALEDEKYDITIIVKQESVADSKKDISYIKYVDCFVKSVGPIELSSDNISVPEYTVVLGFNWQELTTKTNIVESTGGSSNKGGLF